MHNVKTLPNAQLSIYLSKQKKHETSKNFAGRFESSVCRDYLKVKINILLVNENIA